MNKRPLLPESGRSLTVNMHVVAYLGEQELKKIDLGQTIQRVANVGVIADIVFVVLMLAASSTAAQQVRDTSFRFENTNPAFPAAAGPVVCIDEGHNNFHTADGRYWAFAELLRQDGYRVEGFGGKFDPKGLLNCSILVIANPGEVGMDDAYPHPSAFTRDDINELVKWVRGGRSLLLIIDHAPIPGAAADLGAVLGINMLDGHAEGPPRRLAGPDIFQLENGTLKRHPILAGRAESERVTRVATFGGAAFHTSVEFQPLMVFGSGSTAEIELNFNLPDFAQSENPRFEIAGWLHGATRRLGQGRLVILGEAAMCTAQRSERDQRPLGMNHPEAAQNPQFCVNVVHWLSGLLDD